MYIEKKRTNNFKVHGLIRTNKKWILLSTYLHFVQFHNLYDFFFPKEKIRTLTLLRNKIWGHTSKLFTVCTLTQTTDRLISSQTHSQELETEKRQQTSSERAGLRYRWRRWSTLFQHAERGWVCTRERSSEPPVTGHSLHLFSCGSALITAALSEKVDQDNSILLHKCRGEKRKVTSLHALRQRPWWRQQEKTPAWIAFNIQTLLNVQFISSKMDFFCLENLLLFYFIIYFPLKTMLT